MKKGFTLAEVLITLGIIGVVSALTIPNLIAKHRETVVISSVKSTFTILSQAWLLAVNELGEPQYWDIGAENTQAGGEKLYKILKPYFIKAKDCGTKQGCFASKYKAMFGETSTAWQPNTHGTYSRIVLNNGTSVVFYSAGTGCKNNTYCGTIYFDINGFKGPNRAGRDYFRLEIRPDKGVTVPSKNGNETCIYNNTGALNGVVCSKWIIYKGNMDYLHRDISSEFATLY